jgi:hypothetical protein
MHLIKITSARMMSNDDTTTLFVAAFPTPCAPSFVVYPKKEETVPIMNPKTAVLRVGGMKLDHSRSSNARVMYRWNEIRDDATKQPGEIHEQREERQRDDTCDDSGDDKKLKGVDRKRFNAIDLFCCSHIGEHSTNSRADASCEEQAGDERAYLNKEGQGLDRRNQGSSTERDKRATGVKCHHGPQRESRGDHERE